MAIIFLNCVINPFRQNKILDRTKFKAFADNKFDIAKMTNSVFERVENTVGNVRKYWLPALFPFPTLFSKAFVRVV